MDHAVDIHPAGMSTTKMNVVVANVADMSTATVEHSNAAGTDTVVMNYYHYYTKVSADIVVMLYDVVAAEDTNVMAETEEDAHLPAGTGRLIELLESQVVEAQLRKG